MGSSILTCHRNDGGRKVGERLSQTTPTSSAPSPPSATREVSRADHFTQDLEDLRFVRVQGLGIIFDV